MCETETAQEFGADLPEFVSVSSLSHPRQHRRARVVSTWCVYMRANSLFLGVYYYYCCAQGRQNCLGGRIEGSFPAVQINPAFRRLIPDGTVIGVDLVTRHDSAAGELVPHWHSLEGKDSTHTAQKLVNGVARFDNLVVKRQKSTVRHKSEDQRVIRLHFTVDYFENGVQKTAEVTSQPVFSSELRIERMSLESCRVDDSPAVFLLTTKVQRKSVGIRVIDPQPRPVDEKSTMISNGWFLDEQRRPTFEIPNDKVETHHQFAVVINMPPFWTYDLSAPYSVELRLTDNIDHTDSPPKMFTYIPNLSSAPSMGVSARRAPESAHPHELRRTNDGAIPGGQIHNTDANSLVYQRSAPSMAVAGMPGQHNMMAAGMPLYLQQQMTSGGAGAVQPNGMVVRGVTGAAPVGAFPPMDFLEDGRQQMRM